MRYATLYLLVLILTSCVSDDNGRYQLVSHGERVLMTDTATGETWSQLAAREGLRGMRQRWTKFADPPPRQR